MKLRGSSRWLLLGFLWMLLIAPTPGAVGSCDDEDADDPVEFSYYCRNREQLLCVRQYLRKEITERERDECRLDAIDACRRRTFPNDCHPTQRAADACISALRSFDTLDIDDDELPECDSDKLCNATPSELGDAGLVR